MPQVQVALRALAAGKSVRVNDVISYIMTASTTDAAKPSLHESTAKRAYAPAEVTVANSTLKPDTDWYLAKQIFPPIERLCAPMPGTDAMHLAECLGLDTRKYSIASTQQSESTEITPLESQIPDTVRFKDCARLLLTCRHCKESFPFEGLAPSISCVSPQGILCPNLSCRKLFTNLTLVAQLEHAIRVHTSRYYDAYLVCDDPSCGNRTRSVSVYGHRCLGPRGRAEGCLGKMRFEFGERALYNQLLYWRGVWDVDGKAGLNGIATAALAAGAGGGEKTTTDSKESVKAQAEFNRERFATCRGVVEGYLGKCGRVWVQMDGIFRLPAHVQGPL